MLARIQIFKLTLVIFAALSCLLKYASPAIYINEKYISIKKTPLVPNKITVNNRIRTTSRASHTLTDLESKLREDADSMNSEFIAQSIQLFGKTRLIELPGTISATSTTFFINNQLYIHNYDAFTITELISIDPLATLNYRIQYINEIETKLIRHCIFGSKLMFVYSSGSMKKVILDMETNSYMSYDQIGAASRTGFGYACNHEAEELYMVGGESVGGADPTLPTSVVSMKVQQSNENHDFKHDSPIPQGGWKDGICVYWDNILLCANGEFINSNPAKSFAFNVPLEIMSISPDGFPYPIIARDFVQYRNNLFILTSSNLVEVYEIRTGVGVTPSFVQKNIIAQSETWERIEFYTSSSLGKLVYFQSGTPGKIKVILTPSI